MNFDYLDSIKQLSVLANNCHAAELNVYSNPNLSAVSSRMALEFIVKLIYQAKLGGLPEKDDLYSLCADPSFTCMFMGGTLKLIATVRKLGNQAVHSFGMDSNTAMACLKSLYYVLNDLLSFMGFLQSPLPKFQDVPKEAPQPAPVPEPVEEEPSPALVKEVSVKLKDVVFCHQEGADPLENQMLAFQGTLFSSGWSTHSELNMLVPNHSNQQIKLTDGSIADYVLTDEANFPIAVIDIKESAENPIAGRQKVKHQMETLEKQYGRKVAGYYSNGYVTMFLDPCGSPARRVYCYHTASELKRIIARATDRKDIHNPVVDPSITNRKPIEEAVKKVCNVYADNSRRKAVVVIATGVGKTRLSIALADILIKNSWATRILFLADRTSLVKQACKAFKQCLPHLSTSEYIGDNYEKDDTAKVILSTYQTMFSLIEPDTKSFGIGHFDLIIVDEAHRSIFNKYALLFDYFDAFMLGLTATPRNEDVRSTYDVFDIQSGVPDYEYNIADAVADGYLVGYDVIERNTKLLKGGITYGQLSPEDREKIESSFGEDSSDLFEGNAINSSLIGKRVINSKTIDSMLCDLMDNGLKIHGGDMLGKTIIFSASVQEAAMIVDRFRVLFPQYGQDFIDRIDATVPTAQTILDHFAVRDTMPMIAVSVDMLDTGVDVPDILNLVFFKPVLSKIKFIQMIGRGTRTSKDIFGPGSDKDGFYIFDYYSNFRFFEVQGLKSLSKTDKNQKRFAGKEKGYSQSGYIYYHWVNILSGLQSQKTLLPYEAQFEQHLREKLLALTLGLNNEVTGVSHELAYVNKYRKASSWLKLDQIKVEEIQNHILPLLPPMPDGPKVKSFDLLIHSIESVAARTGSAPLPGGRFGFTTYAESFNLRTKWLLRATNIPQVKAKESEIVDMQNGKSVLSNYSLEQAENVRLSLRKLMDFLPDDRRFVVIEVDDYILTPSGSSPSPVIQKPYSERAQEYIDSNRDTDIALVHLFTLEPLTDEDKAHLQSVFESELGTPAEFSQWSNGVSRYAFLRSKVGIDEATIVGKFGHFYQNPAVLDQQQQDYIAAMIDFARANGDIQAINLQNSPFVDIAPKVMNVFGPKLSYVRNVLDVIHDAIK